MTKILFIAHDGSEQTVNAKNGDNIMETAVSHSVLGIDADCGGTCACATCHVYIDEKFTAITGAPNEMEQSMLDFAEDVQANSRLSCQIVVTDKMDGMIVRTPESQ